MDVKEVKINQDQPVKSNADVLISVLVGNAQIGGSVVLDDTGQQLAKGRITNFNLGNGAALIGRSYKVITNVLDVNDSDPAHLAIVTHRFSNVKNNFRHEDSIPKGGIISFEVTYNFIAG
jgi:hypothetical protein